MIINTRPSWLSPHLYKSLPSLLKKRLTVNESRCCRDEKISLIVIYTLSFYISYSEMLSIDLDAIMRRAKTGSSLFTNDSLQYWTNWERYCSQLEKNDAAINLEAHSGLGFYWSIPSKLWVIILIAKSSSCSTNCSPNKIWNSSLHSIFPQLFERIFSLQDEIVAMLFQSKLFYSCLQFTRISLILLFSLVLLFEISFES